jgi:hypothetical protein
MTDDEIKNTLRRIQSNIRVTKVVATRSVKGKGGDTYAGFSAAWNSVQDDAGGGIDALINDVVEAQGGMTLKEARVAHLMIAMQADLAAHDAALAGGNISINYHREAAKAIKANYSRVIRDTLAGPSSSPPTESK